MVCTPGNQMNLQAHVLFALADGSGPHPNTFPDVSENVVGLGLANHNVCHVWDGFDTMAWL